MAIDPPSSADRLVCSREQVTEEDIPRIPDLAPNQNVIMEIFDRKRVSVEAELTIEVIDLIIERDLERIQELILQNQLPRQT